MPNYRRAKIAGGTYFFTLNLFHRHNNNLLIRHIDDLTQAIKIVKGKHPFKIHGWVVLPEHMHFIIELPQEDSDYPLRLRLIKLLFSKSIVKTERISQPKRKRGERGVWQRRYWEHLIRGNEDYQMHMNYLHFNPVKHGLVYHVKDWPYSTFHRCVKKGIYPIDWGGACDESLDYGE